MSGPSDDELLAALGRGLHEPPSRPSPQELGRLRADFRAATGGRSSLRVRFLRPVPVLAAAVLAVGTSTGAAAATGVALPGPLRSAAVAIGLPVDDGAVAQARTQLDVVSQTLSSRDQSRLAGQVAALKSRLATLSESDRAEVEPLATGVLRHADNALSGSAHTGRTGESGGGPGSASQSGDGRSGSSSPSSSLSGDHDGTGTTESGDGGKSTATSDGGNDGRTSPSGSTGGTSPSTGSGTDGSGSDGGTGSTSGSSTTPSGGDGDQTSGGATRGPDGGGTSGSGSQTTPSTIGTQDGGTTGGGSGSDGGGTGGGSTDGGGGGGSGTSTSGG